MKIIGAFLLVVACVHANSIHRYGWTPLTETVFRFESQILKGIPDIRKDQYAGMKIMAHVRVQAFQDYTLRIKIEQPRFVTLNGEISITEANRIIGNGGPRSGSSEVRLGSFQRHLEEPILVHMKRGVIENFYVSRDEPVAVTNIKRSVLSQLQLDVSSSPYIQMGGSQMGRVQPLSHKVLEESVIGKCHTMYNIIPMTPARVIELERSWEEEERSAQLTPSEQGKLACKNKPYYEIIKTRDLDNCDYAPAFQHVAGAEFSGDATKAHVADIASHMLSSTTYACGELSDFTIRKIVVDDYYVYNPVVYNTEENQITRTRIMMELLEKKPSVSSPLPVPAQTRKETSLVYEYPAQRSSQHLIEQEIREKTRQILGTVPVVPQPGLDTPVEHTVEMPKNEIVNKVVAQIKLIARELYESPESISSRQDIAGKLVTASKYMQALNLNYLEQVWTQTLAGIPEEQKVVTKQLLLDTFAMIGTNPATMLVVKKIDAAEICFIKATATIQSAINSIQTPTKELLSKLIDMVKKWKDDANLEKKKLLTPTLFQLSNLFYKAYVNPSTMVSNYPVRIYGIFGTNSSDVLVNKYIPMLAQMLETSMSKPNKYYAPALIVALGKLGHLEAVKPILEIAQSKYAQPKEEAILRSLAIYSLKRVARRNPEVIKPVLLAVANNPVEHADVRVAAIAVLPWARPSFAELQRIAVRSWYETSNQVASFARSTFISLIHTEVPELKPVAMKAKLILHMFKPKYYGLDFSKNVHVSNFVEYLLATFHTEVAYTATKESIVPSRVSYEKKFLVQVLGEGIKANLQSLSVYSQGMERAIDAVLKIREVFGDMFATEVPIAEELRKIAGEIQLHPRILPEFKALIINKNLGYEYALELTANTFFGWLEQISHGNVIAKLSQGVETNVVAAANLFSMTVYKPTEAGILMFARRDMTSALAAKAFLKHETTQGLQIKGSLMPVWNIKLQSSTGVVLPFNKEVIACGVRSSLHIGAPLEGVITARKGELDIVWKFPQQVMRRGRNVEAIHGSVLPFTVRKQWEIIEPLNMAHDLKELLSGAQLKRVSKSFGQLVKGQFNYESDNKFIDFYSYWEKIRQTRLTSYPEVIPFLSSLRKTSVQLLINPGMCELKEVALKLRLWTQKPSRIMALISKPLDSAAVQQIQGLPSLKKALSYLVQAPATLIKAEGSIKRNSVVEKVESFAIVGYNPNRNRMQPYQVKSTVAAAIKLPQVGKTYGILYEGNLQRPEVNARWNKDQLLNQPLELKYNAEVVYGEENYQQTQQKILLRSTLRKSPMQIKAVRESKPFRKCAMEEAAGRRLSPICIKARHQAGSVDTVNVEVDFPRKIYESSVLPTIEQIIKACFFAHYEHHPYAQQVPAGKVFMELNFTRSGDVADLKVKHQYDAYVLKNLRVPRKIQGVMPLSVRNPPLNWMEHKAIANYAPASCRIEPEIVSTFDNKTYSYKINDCEHVLFMDGSSMHHAVPVAVVAKKVSGEQKMIRIHSGVTKLEIIPESGSLKVMLNGHEQRINSGETFVKEHHQTRMIIVEIKRYHDGVYQVYIADQMLYVITDGKSIEIVAPQLLRNRAVGLCGDLNGEEVADLASPQNCIMEPKFAAYSYMLNKEGTSAPRCSGIPQRDLPEYKRQAQQCIKEEIIPTAIVPLFERARASVIPLASAHKVEKKTNQVCISKEKVKACGGQTGPSSATIMKTKSVPYACIAAPSSKATSLEQRAKAGEALGVELGVLPTAYTKPEAEPKYCATGEIGGFGGNYGIELDGGYGASGIGGAYGNGYGPSGSQGGYGIGGGFGNGYSSGNGASGMGGAFGNGYGASGSQGGYGMGGGSAPVYPSGTEAEEMGGYSGNGYGASGSQGGYGMGGGSARAYASGNGAWGMGGSSSNGYGPSGSQDGYGMGGGNGVSGMGGAYGSGYGSNGGQAGYEMEGGSGQGSTSGNGGAGTPYGSW